MPHPWSSPALPFSASRRPNSLTVTTVTFEDRSGKTLLRYHEVYPSPQALEEALEGSAAALPEQLEQLEALLAGMRG